MKHTHRNSKITPLSDRRSDALARARRLEDVSDKYFDARRRERIASVMAFLEVAESSPVLDQLHDMTRFHLLDHPK